MSDCEQLMVADVTKHRPRPINCNDDDLVGLIVMMGSKIDLREIFILWVVFIFLHTELMAEQVLKRISGATNDDNTLTMKGTLIASLIMVMAIIVCAIIF